MAIVPIYVNGAESASDDEANPGGIGGSSSTTTQVRTGSRSIQFNYTVDSFTKILDQSYQQLRIAVAERQSADPGPTPNLISLANSGNTTTVAQARRTATGIELRVLGNVVSSYDMTWYTNVWRHWGIDIKVHSTNGWVYWYLNGVLILSFTGNTGTTNVQRFIFNKASTTAIRYIDDLVIWDSGGESGPSVVPDIKLYPAFPNGQGGFNGGVGSDGNSVDNWALVDEYPPSDADYFDISASGTKDTSHMASPTISGSIPFVTVMSRAIKTNASVDSRFRFMLYDGTNQAFGSDIVPPTSFSNQSYHQSTFTQQPNSSAWTLAAWDNMQAGIEGRETF